MTISKRVYIAYTGGTIGMAQRADGTYAPQPGYLSQRMAAMPDLHGPTMPAYTVAEYNPLLDSSNMTPAHWSRIASDIQQHYADYDGFVILHGTDTMAYSASALAFMLRGLNKPVIFTGSQIPLFEVRSDARTNLVTSLLIAAYHALPEVGLCFGGTLLRGCRATKVHTSGFNAFLSPNCPPLATVGIDITINRALLRGAFPADTPLTVQVIDPALRVAALRLFPGISGAMLAAVLDKVQGLVIEAFGAGNGPDHDADFLAAISGATAQGKVVVVCTQCLYGGADLARYATGSSLAQAGAISGYDMTAEAALTKLLTLLSSGVPPAEVRRLMGVDLRGELTLPSSSSS